MLHLNKIVATLAVCRNFPSKRFEGRDVFVLILVQHHVLPYLQAKATSLAVKDGRLINGARSSGSFFLVIDVGPASSSAGKRGKSKWAPAHTSLLTSGKPLMMASGRQTNLKGRSTAPAFLSSCLPASARSCLPNSPNRQPLLPSFHPIPTSYLPASQPLLPI